MTATDRRALGLALFMALTATLTAPAVADDGIACRQPKPRVQVRPLVGYPAPAGDVDPQVHVVAPTTKPDTLVLVAPGLGHTAVSWHGHISWMAERLNVLAAAVTYPGLSLHDDLVHRGTDLPKSAGWPVTSGATALVDTARELEEWCPSIDRVILLGVSMGANVSGYALAEHQPTSVDGTPLFDWWIDVEGVNNMPETYAAASAGAPATARAIEADAGGTPAEVGEQPYLARSNVNRAADIDSSGITRTILVHAIGDGLVPYDQSRELAAAYDVLGHPYEFHTVIRRGTGEDGTAPEDHAEAFGFPDVENPLAGHASEKSSTHIVMRTALHRLADLVLGFDDGCGEYLVDEARQPEPDPQEPNELDAPFVVQTSVTRPC